MKKVVKVFRVLDKDQINQVCRCCLSQEATTHNIFELTHEKVPFVQIFTTLLQTIVNSNDDMPKNICETCLGKILQFHTFKKTYYKVGRVLATIVAKNKQKTPEKPTESPINSENEPIKTDTKEHISIKTEEEPIESEAKAHIPIITENAIKLEPEPDPEDLKTNSKPSKPIHKPDSREHTCSCFETFDTASELRKHRKQQNHRQRCPVFCKICNKYFSAFKNHKYIHYAEKQFQCRFCGQRFRQRCTLQRHELIHKGNKRHICEICGKGFIRLSEYKLHKNVHTGEQAYICEYCGVTFKSKGGYIRHKMKHENPNEIKRQSLGKFPCNICNKTFTTEDFLHRHYSNIHSIRLYCADCKLEFPKLSDYCNHFETIHSEGTQTEDNTKKLQCGQCDKWYSNEEILNVHTQIRHKKDESLSCPICWKTFSCKTTLKHHNSIHTGEKPHACTNCSRTFRLKAELNIHMKIHTGKPFICEICHKRFLRRTDLAIHKRTHTGEKPYTCVQCKKSFAHTSTLSQHIRSHKGEKPFSCDLCPMKFTRSSHRNQHRARHLKKQVKNNKD